MMNSAGIDVTSNRTATKYSRREQVARVAWAFGAFVFRFTPRPLFGVRRLILRLFGARVGRRVNVYPTARITMPWNVSIGELSSIGEDALIYSLGHISIGRRTTVSQRAHLCAGTHDYNDPAFRLLKPPISIGDEVWICADAFVGPGITVSNRAIVAARAVVVRDVSENTIVAGNPARPVKNRPLR